jgi:hypothetical protein
LKLGPFNDIEGENKHMISPDGLSFDESLALDLNNKMALLEELLNGGGGAFATFLSKDEILHLLRSLAKLKAILSMKEAFVYKDIDNQQRKVNESFSYIEKYEEQL